MKELLVSMLLLVTVIAIYLSVVDGAEGSKGRLASMGSRMAEEIRSTDP
ncbi:MULTISPECIES: hypothetical protein [unclassified Paenibacillus]|nr:MULTISPECIES: hypothetical protein [unclassified Paenibacillus]QID16048.1 hypothetical protein CIC07_25280 [Paenibacillus sp. RUD330]SIR57846.1 hypothetical protein SAMN05880555_4325 [Paenibacillus sp. RU4X]SIR66581.1 hypothetical protein SAMN05880570_4327 [Paenibacillus sp. RU4T]